MVSPLHRLQQNPAEITRDAANRLFTAEEWFPLPQKLVLTPILSCLILFFLSAFLSLLTRSSSKKIICLLAPPPFLQTPKYSCNQSLFSQQPSLSSYCSCKIILCFRIHDPRRTHMYQHPLGVFYSAFCVSGCSFARFWAFGIYTACPASLPPFSLTTNYWHTCEQHTLLPCWSISCLPASGGNLSPPQKWIDCSLPKGSFPSAFQDKAIVMFVSVS